MVCFKLTFSLHLFKQFKSNPQWNNQISAPNFLTILDLPLDEKYNRSRPWERGCEKYTPIRRSSFLVFSQWQWSCSLPRKWRPLITCPMGFLSSLPLGALLDTWKLVGARDVVNVGEMNTKFAKSWFRKPLNASLYYLCNSLVHVRRARPDR